MGRRLNLSTPTVINTELIPFDESFHIDANGQLEQWYYDNTNSYAPNRKLTPLTLTPTLSVFDGDSKKRYSPTFYTVSWFEQAYNTSTNKYEETEITNITDGDSAEYVKIGNKLLVKKNVSYTRSVTIRCEAVYIDPRDSGVTYTTGGVAVLSTNRDASAEYPTLSIDAPSSQSYNPLKDGSSRFTLNATAMKGNTDVTDSTDFLWFAIMGTSEVAINQTLFPWYVSGQGTKTLVVDAMYGEDIRIVLRSKEDVQETTILHPDKAYCSIMWRIPDIDTHVLSRNGGAVRSNMADMAFETVVNALGTNLSDEMKSEHLRFNWKIRKNTSSTETDMGWGQQITIPASNIRSVVGSSSSLASTLVFPYVYLMGAYEYVTDGGVAVTDNGSRVVDRPVF